MLCVGPKSAKIVFITDAPGEDDERAQKPLQGSAGAEFNRMLGNPAPTDSWGRPDWSNSPYHIVSVFPIRPPSNNPEAFFAKKKEGGVDLSLPAFGRGWHLRSEHSRHVSALHDHLASLTPSLIVALGAVPLWALVGTTGLRGLRGAVTHSRWGPVLPTFSPANILRSWSDRPIAIADLGKAHRYAQAGYVRPSRQILIAPTIQETREFLRGDVPKSTLLSVDIETKSKQITCVGIATSSSKAIVIPFWDSAKPDQNFWTGAEEHEVWRMIRDVMNSPIPKLFQNGAYDIQYFLSYGISVRNAHEDSMILQHALYPELPKGLGFLGSVHTDEPAWKLMRRNKADTVKRDDE